MVVQQLVVYWSVVSDGTHRPDPAARSPDGQSPTISEPQWDEQQREHEDLVLQPMDCILALKMLSAGNISFLQCWTILSHLFLYSRLALSVKSPFVSPTTAAVKRHARYWRLC